MKSWEFLIQKKDNPAWLSLKTQKLKLEAGEYRLVARSHRPNIDVEVRVTYQPLEEPRPQPRSQKRNARTNAEGLLAIAPFINFQPGLWQISCSCDLMSELLGEPWQEVVRLHVLPLTATPEEAVTLETPLPDAVTLETTAVTEDSPRQPNAIATETDPPRLDAIAPAPPSADADAEIDPEEVAAIESLLDRSIQNLEQILASAGQTDEPPVAPEPAPLPTSALADALEKLQLRLTLYHENFVRHQGESLLISGQVDAIDPERNDLQPFLATLGGQPVRLLLRFLLRDPQTSAPAAGQVEEEARIQTLFDSQDPSASTALPKIFGYRLEVPQEYRNPLILGEAILEMVVGSENSPSQEEMEKIVARSPFTIAAAV
ncbi:MAG: hypothetical protein SVX43_06325, partial [Cyanobacteriota bacterium]|nr:hypothetical protein [Cyanobacteriota bacterium]